jgi:hypothetical protein
MNACVKVFNSLNEKNVFKKSREKTLMAIVNKLENLVLSDSMKNKEDGRCFAIRNEDVVGQDKREFLKWFFFRWKLKFWIVFQICYIKFRSFCGRHMKRLIPFFYYKLKKYFS